MSAILCKATSGNNYLLNEYLTGSCDRDNISTCLLLLPSANDINIDNLSIFQLKYDSAYTCAEKVLP